MREVIEFKESVADPEHDAYVQGQTDLQIPFSKGADGVMMTVPFDPAITVQNEQIERGGC